MTKVLTQQNLLDLLVQEKIVASLDENSLSMTMAELNVDSLVLVELVMMLEEKLDVEFDLAFIDASTSLQELIDAVCLEIQS